jgi:hypothetical protein
MAEELMAVIIAADRRVAAKQLAHVSTVEYEHREQCAMRQELARVKQAYLDARAGKGSVSEIEFATPAPTPLRAIELFKASLPEDYSVTTQWGANDEATILVRRLLTE